MLSDRNGVIAETVFSLEVDCPGAGWAVFEASQLAAVKASQGL